NVHWMLDENCLLSIARARELVTMIEARPFTKEYLGDFYLKNMTDGVDPHPTSRMIGDAIFGEGHPVVIEDFGRWASWVRNKREKLLTILKKSIDLDEPLRCSV